MYNRDNRDNRDKHPAAQSPAFAARNREETRGPVLGHVKTRIRHSYPAVVSTFPMPLLRPAPVPSFPEKLTQENSHDSIFCRYVVSLISENEITYESIYIYMSTGISINYY